VGRGWGRVVRRNVVGCEGIVAEEGMGIVVGCLLGGYSDAVCDDIVALVAFPVACVSQIGS